MKSGSNDKMASASRELLVARFCKKQSFDSHLCPKSRHRCVKNNSFNTDYSYGSINEASRKNKFTARCTAKACCGLTNSLKEKPCLKPPKQNNDGYSRWVSGAAGEQAETTDIPLGCQPENFLFLCRLSTCGLPFIRLAEHQR